MGPTCSPIEVFPDPEVLAVAAARRITELAAQVLGQRDTFYLALSGGITPRRCYELLRSSALDWSRIQVYFSDERCLPRGDPGRNDTLAYAALLDHVPIPRAHIHPIPAEDGPSKAAADYSRKLAPVLPFDLILLGVGEDGHTASLFPGHSALTSKALAVPIFDAPKLPAERVSLGLGVLNGARHKLFLVVGSAKHKALQQLTRGMAIPAAKVVEAEWYVDRDALAGETC